MIKYIDIDGMEIDNLYDGLTISTMCASCKLNTKLDIINIENYLQLNPNDILTVKRSKDRIRTLLTIKSKPKRVKKLENNIKQKDTTKNHFYNQITVVIRIDDGEIKDINKVPKINVKLFKNGSVQMSGCKTVNGINIVLNKLIIRLKEVKAKIENGIINEIAFIEDSDNITIKDFKIDMINSNYKLKMQINRNKLYDLLIKKKIKSAYEPCIRACVIIKYIPKNDNNENKEVSIFVFQKGNILIAGARSKSHILSSYDYINNIITTHYDDIIKKNEEIEEQKILNYAKQFKN